MVGTNEKVICHRSASLSIFEERVIDKRGCANRTVATEQTRGAANQSSHALCAPAAHRTSLSFTREWITPLQSGRTEKKHQVVCAGVCLAEIKRRLVLPLCFSAKRPGWRPKSSQSSWLKCSSPLCFLISPLCPGWVTTHSRESALPLHRPLTEIDARHRTLSDTLTTKNPTHAHNFVRRHELFSAGSSLIFTQIRSDWWVLN